MVTIEQSTSRLGAAVQALSEADTAWTAELVRQFGPRARDVRYTAPGKGVEGTSLRTLSDRFSAARAEHSAAWDEHIAVRPAPVIKWPAPGSRY